MHLAPTPRPHTLSLRHSPCPPGTLSSPPHPLSPWCDSLASFPMWSHLTACCRLLMSRVPLPPCCRSLVRLPLPATAPPPPNSPLGACCLAFPLYPVLTFSFFVAHMSFSVLTVPRLVLTIARSSWGRCHHVTGLGAILPSSGPGVSPSLPPSAGSCSSTCPGSVSSQRSGPAFMAQRSSQPWSTCTRGTWCTATSR